MKVIKNVARAERPPFEPTGGSAFDPNATRPTVPTAPDYGIAPGIPSGEVPHVTKKDISSGTGLVTGTNSEIHVDKNEFYDVEMVNTIVEQVEYDYKNHVDNELSHYNEWVEYEYATKEDLENLDDAAMSNYTPKSVTNQVWTTSVTTFATKKELDAMGKKYGVGVVIRGNVESSGVLNPIDPAFDPEYSPSHPKRFQGESYFTQDKKHLWQFIANNILENVPQIMIDRPEIKIAQGNTKEESLFQLWIGREHPDPEELITIKMQYNGGDIVVKDAETDEVVTEVTSRAGDFAPDATPKKKYYIDAITANKTTAILNLTAWDGEGEIPQILVLSIPVMLNGAVRPEDVKRAMIQESTKNGVRQAKSAASTYRPDPIIELEPEIVGLYGKWVDLGTIVGPANQLDEIVPVTTLKREPVTQAGALPNLSDVGFEARAEIQNEYPDQQLFLTIPEGVQGAPGARGFIGNKAIPTLVAKDWMDEKSFEMLGFEEFDWNNAVPGSDNDPNNPNVPGIMPSPVRIEGMSAFEVWAQYHAIHTPGADETNLTKDNYFYDITGDSAFKFWRDYMDITGGTGDFTGLPGYGIEFDDTDIDAYAQFQRGDAYIPVWDEATGTMQFKFWDDIGDPQESGDHTILETAGGVLGTGTGLRVRGQVYRPSLSSESVISWTRADEPSTEPTIVGGNIRGNAWVPTVDSSGTISWENTIATDNANAVVAPSYIRGEVYSPVVTNEIIFDDIETTKVVDIKENLDWEVKRKPSDVIPAPPVNIKGRKGAAAKLELILDNNVSANDEFGITISEPVFETTGPDDFIGTNTQILTVATPFDKYNLKVASHDGTDTAWYLGVDETGRVITSNVPFTTSKTRNNYRKEQDRRLSDMRKQIDSLQKQLNLKK